MRILVTQFCVFLLVLYYHVAVIDWRIENVRLSHF